MPGRDDNQLREIQETELEALRGELVHHLDMI